MPAGGFSSQGILHRCLFFFCEEKVKERFFRKKISWKTIGLTMRVKTHMWEPRKWWFFKTFAPILIHSLAARKEDDTDDEAKKRKLRQRGGMLSFFFEDFGVKICYWAVATQIFFYFYPLFGEDSHFDLYFWDGLKPPTRLIFWIVELWIHNSHDQTKFPMIVNSEFTILGLRRFVELWINSKNTPNDPNWLRFPISDHWNFGCKTEDSCKIQMFSLRSVRFTMSYIPSPPFNPTPWWINHRGKSTFFSFSKGPSRQNSSPKLFFFKAILVVTSKKILFLQYNW